MAALCNVPSKIKPIFRWKLLELVFSLVTIEIKAVILYSLANFSIDDNNKFLNVREDDLYLYKLINQQYSDKYFFH